MKTMKGDAGTGPKQFFYEVIQLGVGNDPWFVEIFDRANYNMEHRIGPCADERSARKAAKKWFMHRLSELEHQLELFFEDPNSAANSELTQAERDDAGSGLVPSPESLVPSSPEA